MPAAKFSSTVLTRNATLHNVADSKKLTLSTWFHCASGEGGDILFGGPSATDRVYLALSQSTGVITFRVRNSAGTTLYLASTDDAYDDDDWHHLAIAVDLANTTVTWRIDRSAPDVTVTTGPTDGTIDFTGSTQWKVGNIFDDGGTNYDGALFDLLLKAGEYVDLTDSDELKKFVSSDGRATSGDSFWQNVGPNSGVKPVGYGVEAAVFNGYPADLYFSGVFQNNLGKAGAFVMSGAFGSEDQLNSYRHAAQYDNKERWFDSDLTGFSYTRSRTFIEDREGHPKKGLRMGIDEKDDYFRLENNQPLHSLLYDDQEEDTEEWDR